jgi:hypothetical protein
MKQNPSTAYSRSAPQNSPYFMVPSLDRNLNQISHFLKIHFNNFHRFELVNMNISASGNAQKVGLNALR